MLLRYSRTRKKILGRPFDLFYGLPSYQSSNNSLPPIPPASLASQSFVFILRRKKQKSHPQIPILKINNNNVTEITRFKENFQISSSTLTNNINHHHFWNLSFSNSLQLFLCNVKYISLRFSIFCCCHGGLVIIVIVVYNSVS